ncbi:hypothetical protein A9Q86_09565 [Flavobacteriales bacterium 33_180_T64]|nr:hypothetical protein A9Q86_09565 [Flavobacteriales bacterium 33_180_T64]
MKQTEKILGALILLFMISRLFFSYPFSAIAITFSILLLAVLYLWLSFGLLNNIRLRNIFKKESYKKTSPLRILGTVLTGFILSLTLIYSLFKFQLWPYGNEGLLISIYGLLIVIIIALIKYLTSKNKFYSSILKRLIFIGTFAVSLYLIPYESLLKIKNRKYPEYVEAEIKSMRDPQNKELQEKAREELMKMSLDK